MVAVTVMAVTAMMEMQHIKLWIHSVDLYRNENLGLRQVLGKPGPCSWWEIHIHGGGVQGESHGHAGACLQGEEEDTMESFFCLFEIQRSSE